MKEYRLCIAENKKVVEDSDSLEVMRIQKGFYEEMDKQDGREICYLIYNSKGEVM